MFVWEHSFTTGTVIDIPTVISTFISTDDHNHRAFIKLHSHNIYVHAQVTKQQLSYSLQTVANLAGGASDLHLSREMENIKEP